jgi:uncharacterized protein YbjT (DUF2867 family)
MSICTTYLITGATGDVGSKVATALIQRGIRPRVFARNVEKAKEFFAGVADFFAGDLGDETALT